jgi:hypothetical protein
MNRSNRSPKAGKIKLLLDSDVIIHFFKADKLFDLTNIFPEYEYVLLDLVWEEELKNNRIANSLKLLINNGSITLLEFPTDDDEIDNEFEYLKYEGRGIGESACMAYAKYNKEDIVASSNLKDLLPYCKNNHISYITTIDFLCEAVKKGLYSEKICNDFIKNVLDKGSKLAIKRMLYYDCSKRKVLEEFKKQTF